MTFAVVSIGFAVVLMMYAAATLSAPRDLAALGPPSRYRPTPRMANLHDSYYTVHLLGVLQVATYDGRSYVSAGPITMLLPDNAKTGWPIGVGAVFLAMASAIVIFRRTKDTTATTTNR